MVDLMFFLCILFVFLIAYGVAVQAILFPNSSTAEEVLVGVFYRSYFQMYGELFLEVFQGKLQRTGLVGVMKILESLRKLLSHFLDL